MCARTNNTKFFSASIFVHNGDIFLCAKNANGTQPDIKTAFDKLVARFSRAALSRPAHTFCINPQ